MREGFVQVGSRKIWYAVYDEEKEADYGERYQSAMMEYYQKHVCRLTPWP